MCAAGCDAEGQVYAFFQQRSRAGGQRGKIRGVVCHFFSAVVHVDKRVGGDVRLIDDAAHFARAQPKAWG